MQGRSRILTLLAVLVALGAQVFCWFQTRDLRADWLNVPPVPSERQGLIPTLGDRELAYRLYSLMLQNLGDIGGEYRSFAKYDYNRLGQWFFLTDKYNPRSNYVPVLAAFYYGATKDPKQMDPLIDYLSYVGQGETGKKWRWLMQAVYLARFGQNDLDKALKLANLLAQNKNPDMPLWAHEMPAFVMTAQGKKEAAKTLLYQILQTKGNGLDPTEVNFTMAYMCNNLFTPAERKKISACGRF